VEAGNAEAFAEVEGVGVVAVGAGVEGGGGAGVGAGVVDEPAEHGFAVAEGAGGGEGDEVVDIEVWPVASMSWMLKPATVVTAPRCSRAARW